MNRQKYWMWNQFGRRISWFSYWTQNWAWCKRGKSMCRWWQLSSSSQAGRNTFFRSKRAFYISGTWIYRQQGTVKNRGCTELWRQLNCKSTVRSHQLQWSTWCRYFVMSRGSNRLCNCYKRYLRWRCLAGKLHIRDRFTCIFCIRCLSGGCWHRPCIVCSQYRRSRKEHSRSKKSCIVNTNQYCSFHNLECSWCILCRKKSIFNSLRTAYYKQCIRPMSSLRNL